jgi:hypothetical protein
MAKRKPVQEDLAYDDIAAAEEAVPTDEVVDNSAMDLIGETPDKKEAPSASSGMDSRTAQTIGRMVAGATPTLFGMLFGPQQAERGIAQTQKFNAAGKTSKLVPIVGPDGAPIYETPDAAIGEKVYQKPTAKANTTSAGSYQAGQGYNPKTKQYAQLNFNTRTGEYQHSDGTPVENAKDWIFKPAGEKSYMVENAAGGKDWLTLNKYDTGGVKSKFHSAGAGEIMTPKGKPPMLKKEAEMQLTTTAEGKKATAKYEIESAGILSDKDTISTTKDPMVFATTTGRALRSVEKRLSEPEQKRFMGDDYKGFMLRGSEYLRSKYGGQIPETVRQNVVNLLNAANEKVQGEKSATLQYYGAGEGLSEQGKAAVNRILGKGIQPSQSNIPSHIKSMSREDKIKKYKELKAQGKI